MEPSNNKKIIIIVAVVIAVVFVVGLLVFWKSSPQSNVSGGEEAAPAPTGPVTREPAPANVVVPEKGSAVPTNVAPPQNVVPLNPNTQSKDRSFSIQAANNQFTPDTLILKSGDNLTLSFTAVDKAYDFVQPDYGFRDGKFVISKGQTRKIIFQVTASGKFKFYCSLCGGPDNGPIGYIVVAP